MTSLRLRPLVYTSSYYNIELGLYKALRWKFVVNKEKWLACGLGVLLAAETTFSA